MGLYQVLPLRHRVDLGVITKKGYFTFPRTPRLWSLTIRWFSVISGHTLEVSSPSSEMQSAYSTISTDWAIYIYIYIYTHYIDCPVGGA